jgi:murein DD-endopeptidase MepM/ murein hydrolase activator NlpD
VTLCDFCHTPAKRKKSKKAQISPGLWKETNRVKNEILARLSPKQKRQLRFGAVILAASGAAFATLGSAEPEKIPTTPISLPLTLNHNEVASLDADARGVFHEEKVQRGDTLGSLLSRLGVDDPAAFQYLRSGGDARLISSNLRPGRSFRSETGGDGELVNLSYNLSPTEMVTVERAGDGFKVVKSDLAVERRVEMKSAEIRASLFGAADAVGLPDPVTTQIAEIFSGDIDFHKDIRKGDRFRVVYEMLYNEGEFVRAGRVLAVEFVNNNKTYAAVWYEGEPGANGEKANETPSGYYTPSGNTLRKAFLRSPLEFSRITSGFGGRLHPILNTWRQHTGVDYAAPMGTDIRSTADGEIAFIGQQNGYGNVVVVRHQGQYSTLYGHMSRFEPGLTKGTRVHQGDIIGHVGMTGWATGPHVHYEFRVADVPVDPLTVALPQAFPLEGQHLAAFKLKAAPLMERIALVREVRQYASID